MLGIAKIGDVGHGYCEAGHDTDNLKPGEPKEMTTTFVSGDTTVFVNYLPVATVGTVGQTDCQDKGEYHTTEAISGSTTVFVGGVGAHRVGDVGIIIEENNQYNGEYTVVSGSTDVLIG